MKFGLNVAMVIALPLAGMAQGAPTASGLDAGQVVQLIEMMPPPAFNAALLDLVTSMGCTLDFSDYPAQEQVLIDGMRQQLLIADDLAEATHDALQLRIGLAFESLTERFSLNPAEQTAELIDGCNE